MLQLPLEFLILLTLQYIRQSRRIKREDGKTRANAIIESAVD